MNLASRVVLLVGFLLVSVGSWANGSKASLIPIATPVVPDAQKVNTLALGQTLTGGMQANPGKGRIKTSGWRSGGMTGKVEFLDESGKTVKVLEQGKGRVQGLWNIADKHVAVLMRAENPIHGRNHGGIVKYLADDGQEIWSTDLCCDTGEGLDRIYVSANGKVIAVTDAGDGGECLAGEDLYAAPKGCFGLRIFTAEGKEVYRELYGRYPVISLSGQFVIFEAPESPPQTQARSHNWKLLDISRGETENLPNLYPQTPLRITDDGTVRYSGAPGQKRYVYIQGKGIEERGVVSPFK